ncbi:hypothetical protein ABDK00_016865 [Niabella insulamsoli]|uniref:hypothetical protein n=1 Tax=Niabella insulamsoli TaxID=3144874 RepID=UPI0031FD276B
MRGIGIQLNEYFDLKLNAVRGVDGKLLGFVLAETTNQNTALILAHQPGQFKDAPTLGVGLDNSLLDHDFNEWKRKIRVNLEQDLQKVKSIEFTNSELTIDAEY